MTREAVTELGRFEFGKDGRVILSRSDKPLTYYKTHWFTWTWMACLAMDGKGCATLGKAQLSLDKAPPPLRDQPELPPPPIVPKPTRAELEKAQLERLLKVADGIHHWWTKPLLPLFPPAVPKLASLPVAKTVSSEPVIPPFDIQDIPDAMDKLKLPVSAAMMRHWFEGQANYSTTRDDLIAGIGQNGKAYPPNMIDQSIIKLDWVLGYPRAQKAYDELLSTAVHTPNAVEIIKEKLSTFIECRVDPFAPLNGMKASNQDIHRLHKDFQFQFVQVDANRLEKTIQWLAVTPAQPRCRTI